MSSICHLLGTTTHYGEALFILGRRAVPNCCRLLMQKFACHSNLPSLIQVLHSCVHALQVAAAREAIGDADFFLIARTDARATSSKRGLDEAINRANIYLVPILSPLHLRCICHALCMHTFLRLCQRALLLFSCLVGMCSMFCICSCRVGKKMVYCNRVCSLLAAEQ